MRSGKRITKDHFYLVFIILLLIGIPLGIRAYDILSVFKKEEVQTNPVLKVTKGDQVVLKLRSSDVTHGFAMKAFGIYISKGIDPGQTIYVRFKADKTGTFMFACTVFCGDIHHSMKGTLIVSEVVSEIVSEVIPEVVTQ